MEQQQQMPAAGSKIRWSKQQAMDCLKDQRQGGQSIKEYCQTNGMSEKTFYRWLKKYGGPKPEKRKRQYQKRGGFASIEIVSNVIDRSPQLFAEVGNVKLYKEVSADYLKKLLS
jgi:AraC-like DNA-binding protein